MFNWRKENFTYIEFMIGVVAFCIIGMGMGVALGTLGVVEYRPYIWGGWGISIIPLLLVFLRLRKKRKKEGDK